ncbi:hypothetical protein AAG906_036837 [Vitis piasezkii]
MARTRGAKSSSPSNRKRVPRGAPVQGPTSEPPRRRYLTRSRGRPLQKRARVESSEPIDLTEQSPVPSPEPSPAPSPAPPAEPQELQPPLSEPQIPSGIAPEVLIRRPMLTQPPIEGNLDCRARPFHSELCFDTATFQLRPELAHSFRLLQIPHGASATPIDFFYPSRIDLSSRRPQPAEIPAAKRASPCHIPEGIPIASPTISRAPPVTPASSEPSTSAEPRMAIPISEYRELCRSLQTLTASQSSLAQEMAAIRACQEQMLTTQAQHTAILRQLQHHFGLPSAAEHSTPTTAVPHSQATEPQAPLQSASEEAEPSA